MTGVQTCALPICANKAAAYAFIDYMLRPENGKAVAEFVLYKVPNSAAMAEVDPALIEQFPNLGLSASQLLGYEASELIGRSFTDVTHPDDVESNLETARVFFAGSQTAVRVEKRYLTKRGHVVYVRVTASPVLGTPQGISVFMDGMRVNEPFGDVVSWDLIPQIAIANITMVPGSNPVFGLNTLGGAVAINTKSGFAFPGGDEIGRAHV